MEGQTQIGKFDALASVDALVEAIDDYKATKRTASKIQQEQAAFTIIRRLKRLILVEENVIGG